MKNQKCPKCGNPMVPDIFPHLNNIRSKQIFGFQCYNCKTIIYVDWKFPKDPSAADINNQ